MKKFLVAFNGLKIAVNHKAVLVQMILGLLATICGLIIRLDFYEWLAFTICIGLVISSEILNTAIEEIGNYLNLNNDDKIRRIKDLSAAGVLISAITSLVVCILVVLRRLI